MLTCTESELSESSSAASSMGMAPRRARLGAASRAMAGEKMTHQVIQKTEAAVTIRKLRRVYAAPTISLGDRRDKAAGEEADLAPRVGAVHPAVFLSLDGELLPFRDRDHAVIGGDVVLACAHARRHQR